MNKMRFIKLKKLLIVKIGKEYFINIPRVGSSIVINGKNFYEIGLVELKKLGYVEEKKVEVNTRRILNTKQLLAA